MGVVLGLAGLLLVLLILVDGFEAVVLPRRVAHAFRITTLFYRNAWPLWKYLSGRLRKGRRRDGFLSLFGPLSLLALLGTWVLGLILGFALMQWGVGEGLNSTDKDPGFWTYLYLSGVTFFTLGYGEVTPQGPVGRLVAVAEAGGGFGFLALIIGYLPVVYQAFSRREITISLLDARAGSPPSAGQFLLRMAVAGQGNALAAFLHEWEHWSAELLESHLSFPFLSYYRSQHDNQSWLATLTFILDTGAILIAAGQGPESGQAQHTFAMARHAAVDLPLIFRTRPLAPEPERLPAEQWQRLRQVLEEGGLVLKPGLAIEKRLTDLRALYEPFVNAMSLYFLFPLPPVWAPSPVVDNWQTSAWMKRTPGLDRLQAPDIDEHPV
jgi:hypothetical protein